MEAVKQPGVLGIEGQAATQKRLLGYLRSGRLHPALLLVGPDPDLKFRVAKNMAKVMLCENPGTRAFCAVCSPCRRIDKELHPDVLFLKEEDEDNIKIEKIRAVCHQMEISPMEARYKICIVPECHRMSTASANAFLKTLEEPAPGRYFWLLTTKASSLLPTIVSRTLTFSFTPEIEPDTTAASQAARLEDLLRETLKTRNPQPLVAELEDKESSLKFLHLLQARFHRLAVSQAGTEDLFPAMDAFTALNKFEAALDLEGRLRSHANCGLLMEDFLRREILP